jgi:anti-sigma factor RsiW
MKCDEVQQLHGLCLDSELDARTTLEIHQHAAACTDCARALAEEEKLNAAITAGLKQGERTAALWEQIERSVLAASLSPSCQRIATPQARPPGWGTVFSTLGDQLRAHLRTPGRAWAGLATVWALILTLNLTAHESDGPLQAGLKAPSASEMRFALRQKYLLMAELAAISEPVAADKPKAAPRGPRADRRNELLNA